MPTTTTTPKPIKNKENVEEVMTKLDLGPLLNDILQNLPEACNYGAFVCTSWRYATHTYKLTDCEDDKKYVMDWEKAMKGLKYVRQQIRDGKLHFYGLDSSNYNDAGNWDAESTDAICQAAVLGEVIYG